MSITRKNGPLYLQIKKIIKDRILHGVYPLGSHIPSEPQLEQEFNVSKMTVRNAIQELYQEGYVEKRSGVGTIVTRNTSFSKLSKGKLFTEILVEEGHQIRKRHLKTEWVHNEPDSELFLKFGERCLLIERLYLLDGSPFIYYTHYVSSLVDMGRSSIQANCRPCMNVSRRVKSRWRISGTVSWRPWLMRRLPHCWA